VLWPGPLTKCTRLQQTCEEGCYCVLAPVLTLQDGRHSTLSGRWRVYLPPPHNSLLFPEVANQPHIQGQWPQNCLGPSPSPPSVTTRDLLRVLGLDPFPEQLPASLMIFYENSVFPEICTAAKTRKPLKIRGAYLNSTLHLSSSTLEQAVTKCGPCPTLACLSVCPSLSPVGSVTRQEAPMCKLCLAGSTSLAAAHLAHCGVVGCCEMG
jgi:hypothetical protein